MFNLVLFEGGVVVVLLVNLVQVDGLINVSVAVPVAWRQELVELDVILQGFGWTVGVPKFQASLDVVLGKLPLT